MDDKVTIEVGQRIQEAHGLWELQVARLAAFAEIGAPRKLMVSASRDERAAFANWQSVSRDCGA